MTYGELLAYRIDAAWASNKGEDGKRRHLGASVIGQTCMRAVWFSWLWADEEKFDGRMLRLFNRGHNQEGIFADLLRGVGATVWTHDEQGNQFRVQALGGHFGGSLDGVAINLPDLPFKLPPETPVLLEFKTHKEKYFNQLVKSGLEKNFPKHVKQAQVYMHLTGIRWCLYMAVNKNTDELWLHFFQYDGQIGTQLLNRANSIIYGEGMPPRISESPAWHECRFCSMRGVCFKMKQADLNCRTCIYSTAQQDGTWRCEMGRPEIKSTPKEGCLIHSFHPDLC